MSRLRAKLEFMWNNIMMIIINMLFDRAFSYRGKARPIYTRFLDGQPQVLHVLSPWAQPKTGRIAKLSAKLFYSIGDWYYSNDYHQWDNRYMKRSNWKGFA